MAMCCTVLMLNTYLKGATIFCDHSGIWNQMMIDKFTTDIKRTKTLICCLIVKLLQYWIDYWIVKQWRLEWIWMNLSDL